jgi:predicted RNA-binding protein
MGDGVPMRLEGAEVPMVPGTRLIASITHKGFYNGDILEFMGEAEPVSDARIHKTYMLYDPAAKTHMTATQHLIEKCCRLGWAITIYSSQAKTLHGVVRMYDLTSPRFSPTLLYVGASRASDPANLECAE